MTDIEKKEERHEEIQRKHGRDDKEKSRELRRQRMKKKARKRNVQIEEMKKDRNKQGEDKRRRTSRKLRNQKE